MRETVNDWLGHHQPKQYCTFVGTRSMLQHTVDRARALVPDNYITTVIGHNHRVFLQAEGNRPLPGKVLEQPRRKETGPGLFLPLTYVMAENPEASVIVFPSDQYIAPEGLFLQKVSRAARLSQTFEDCLILLGAVPDRCETDYGWITTRANSLPLRGFADAKRIEAFIEKPCSATAEACLLSGAYWNTMVMAVKARTLWQMGWQLLPAMMRGFDSLRQVLIAVRDGRADPQMVDIATQHLYRKLAPADFSRCILGKVTDRLLVLPLSDVEWSDWGRPSRIVESLNQTGKVPRFLRESFRRGYSSKEIAPVQAGKFDGNQMSRPNELNQHSCP